jgi:seryl-tRNA synthetase
METKEQLVKCVKNWVKIDNEIRALKKELNNRNKEKKDISKDLMDVMRENEIDCFDINNGKIMYVKKNVKKPISAKALLGIISNYYDGDTEKASDLNNYILSNREEVVKETIVRK